MLAKGELESVNVSGSMSMLILIAVEVFLLKFYRSVQYYNENFTRPWRKDIKTNEHYSTFYNEHLTRRIKYMYIKAAKL